jgi:predicted acyltransferase
MLLSGQLPFGENALPTWMYHAQVPPPAHEWNGKLPGITWVDLVFPFFLFSMGAAFPLALSRRLEQGWPKWRLGLLVLERGFLLGFFALYVQAIRPYVLSKELTTRMWLAALLGFALLFPILTRLPSGWKREWRWGVRGMGWAGAVLFLALARYPDGSGFSLRRSDIIIVVLANMAVFGSLAWLCTRGRWLPRLGILGVLCAFRLSNMPQLTPGWVHELWRWSPAPWIYQLYYLQYLFIVIPGTIAGDLILEWLRPSQNPARQAEWPKWRYAMIAGLMFAMVLVSLVGLKARWLLPTTLTLFAMCALGWWLMAPPGDDTARLLRQLFGWAIFWLVLGLCFEPYEGGIKKDKATMSYYFVTTGLALGMLIFFTILIHIFKARRWLQLLIDNGQNPMIAYAGINNFIIPVLALTGAESLLDRMAVSPWLGFLKGLIITLLLAVCVSVCTRRRIFWRT